MRNDIWTRLGYTIDSWSVVRSSVVFWCTGLIWISAQGWEEVWVFSKGVETHTHTHKHDARAEVIALL